GSRAPSGGAGRAGGLRGGVGGRVGTAHQPCCRRRGVTQDASVDTRVSPAYTRADIPVRTVSVSERRSPMRAPHTADWTPRRFLGGLTIAGAERRPTPRAPPNSSGAPPRLKYVARPHGARTPSSALDTQRGLC